MDRKVSEPFLMESRYLEAASHVLFEDDRYNWYPHAPQLLEHQMHTSPNKWLYSDLDMYIILNRVQKTKDRKLEMYTGY